MLKALIIDDEAPARSELHYMIQEHGKIELIHEASSVKDALEKLKTMAYDILFLDINMPGVSGMRLAEGIQQVNISPAIIFVTAYSDFAAQAFKVNAVDYLLKPVEEERLAQAIAKAEAYIKMNSGEAKPERISAEKNGKRYSIDAQQICFIMARDDYAYIYTTHERYITSTSLQKLEDKLCAHNFARIHRRYLVNIAKVMRVITGAGGALELSIEGYPDELLPVSRRRTPYIKQLLNL